MSEPKYLYPTYSKLKNGYDMEQNLPRPSNRIQWCGTLTIFSLGLTIYSTYSNVQSQSILPVHCIYMFYVIIITRTCYFPTVH
jgi:hypothetical protein